MTTSSEYQETFSRNLGIYTASEQDRLRKSSVGVAGVGGVGGLLVERLVRLGVGRIKITDPERFELSNLNRQFASCFSNLGRDKAEIVRDHVADINPGAAVSVEKKGIRTQQDADRFVDGCDVVADEMDFGLFRESVFLQRAARRTGVYYLLASAIGFGALLAVFDPGGCTLEEYNGLPVDLQLDSDTEPVVGMERTCPIVPSYVLDRMEVVQAIAAGEMPVSANAVGCGLGAVLAANEIANLLLKKRPPICAPQYLYVDLLDRRLVVGAMEQDSMDRR